MLSRLVQMLWGQFESRQEFLKFIRLAGIFAFTIGVYWIINPTKEVVFFHTVGVDYFPYAKIFSVLCLIPAIMFYGRLVDRFSRDKVFYILCLISAVSSLLFGYCMMHPTIGLTNTVLSQWRLLGWAWYSFVEIFGSLMVALFWSFAADTSTPDAAKRGFSVIALGAQIGGVLGPLAFKNSAAVWGPSPFAFIGAVGMICIAILVYCFMKVTPKSELIGFKTEKKSAVYRRPKPGFLEGIKLIFSHPYLIGIALVVTLYELVVTVIDIHLKTQAKLSCTGINDLNQFFFKYAILANGVALFCLLFGVGAIGRRLGLLKTLLLLPILVLAGVITITFSFTLDTLLLVFVFTKGLNYGLNQPAKEQLYIPTSKDSKYKAKAWIDMFGSRMAKGVGSSVHMLRPVLQLSFVGVSSLMCGGLIGIWIIAVLFVGKAHQEAIKEDKVIC